MTFSRGVVLAGLLLACGTLVEAQRGGGGGGGGFGGGGGRGGGAPAGGRGVNVPQETRDRENRPQEEAPTFRSSVTVVQVDAIVTDASGAPVTGLTESDFEVLEGSRKREITNFAAVSIPLPDATPISRAESDMQTNARPPGRTYLIALDEVGADRALKARHFLRRFIEQYFGPDDVAAVALTGRGLATSGQDFTSNKRLILAAIDKFTGGFEEFDAKAVASSDARQLGSSMRKLTEFLAMMPGRKVMLYVGESMGGLDAYAATSYHGTTLTPGELDFHEAIAAATRGNVTIYPVDPRGLTTDTTAAESFDTTNLDARADLAAIADVTGGFALSSSNNFAGAIDRMVRENSSYYTIGFASEYEKRDGRFVGVQVRTKRPGLTVRARNGFVAPLGKEPNTARITGDAKMATVASAVANPIAVSDVPMRAVATTYKGTGSNASVALVVEIDVSKLELVEKNGILTGPIELTYVITDAKGKVRNEGRRHSATITLKKDAASIMFKTGIRLISEFELPKGRYQVRIGAGSASRAGSIVYDLEVPDFNDGLQLSGISVTTASAPAVSTLRVKDPLGNSLPGPPVAYRDFSNQDVIGIYVEAYDAGHRSQPPEMTAEIRTADGAVVGRLEQRPTATLHGESAARGMTAQMPLAKLAPGNYILRVDARSQGNRDAVAVREIPIRIWQ
jgi:VWFA-related protein